VDEGGTFIAELPPGSNCTRQSIREGDMNRLPPESEVARARSASLASQVVDYIFFLVFSLVGLEIVLEALGARQASGFKQFLDAVTGPLLAPFRGLLPSPSFGSAQLMLSYVAALAVYAILHQAIRRLLRMFTGRAERA
jgi:uncharacterized protein YggT (Ycf19 family)